ncbi:MAG: HypC/HybG/HupF family hydrogenase formation chaperone [Spirochaetales bacterium]|jgi:hydrogenase expression/formation protein HypC|nr:HypC/HybG/HupF family hydrogenase formation chaperone [Spirochaetales bacterium]
MCLAVPLQIEKINDNSTASVIQGSVLLDVDISLLDAAVVGDYVIVHAGYAIEKLDLQEAETRLDMFNKLSQTTDES